MQEVIVQMSGELERIPVSLVCGSRNPKTKRYSINLYHTEDGKQNWVQLFCQEDKMEELVLGIREGRLTDLTGYPAERRL